MITLITGTPGAGKTLYTVAEILPQYADRTLYIDGIPDLLVDHEEPAGEVADWHIWLPENAVLVVDEVQRIWRPRHAGSQVPAGVAAMETHRHRGQDIVLITQHPNLLDNNVRRLVGRHLHIRRVFGWKRALVHEWDHCSDPGRVSTAIRRPWGYPRKAFGLYRSATAHTARNQRTPWVMWGAVAAGLLVVPAIWYAYDRINQRIEDPIQAQSAASQQATAGYQPQITTPAWAPEAFRPRDYLHPESAPAYDGLRQVVTYPLVSGCVATQDRCLCYTQQATRVYLPDHDCRRLADTPAFDHYRVGGWAARDERPAPGADGSSDSEPDSGSDNRVHSIVMPDQLAQFPVTSLAGRSGDSGHVGRAGQ